MKVFRMLAAVAVVAVPALFASVPAQAVTSRQYMAQGHGRYVNSSGTRKMYGHRYHRHHRHYWRHHRYHHYR